MTLNEKNIKGKTTQQSASASPVRVQCFKDLEMGPKKIDQEKNDQRFRRLSKKIFVEKKKSCEVGFRSVRISSLDVSH